MDIPACRPTDLVRGLSGELADAATASRITEGRPSAGGRSSTAVPTAMTPAVTGEAVTRSLPTRSLVRAVCLHGHKRQGLPPYVAFCGVPALATPLGMRCAGVEGRICRMISRAKVTESPPLRRMSRLRRLSKNSSVWRLVYFSGRLLAKG